MQGLGEQKTVRLEKAVHEGMKLVSVEEIKMKRAAPTEPKLDNWRKSCSGIFLLQQSIPPAK